MFKKRIHSVYSDFKTGILCKIFIYLGIILVIISAFFLLASNILNESSTGFLKDIYSFSKTTYPESVFAFAIIFIAVGIILYFFQCQFAKLAKIAEEIENDEDLK